MTLLLREVAALLAGAATWLAMAVAVAAVPALLASTGEQRGYRGRLLRLALVGGLLGAGIVSRLGGDDPLTLTVMRRPFPITWVLAGAIAATVWGLIRKVPSPDRGEESAVIPAPGAARP